MDLNLLGTLFLRGILQKGRVSPNMLPTPSLQIDILSTILERKMVMQTKHLKKKKNPFYE